MLVAQSSADLLYNLHEIRPKDAIRSFRKAVIHDYPGDRCAYCGSPATSWTLDHIIPKSKGGPTRRWNLARCCTKCNGNKSNLDLLPWYRPQLFWAEDRENTVFDWMRENASMDAMLVLQDAIMEGVIDHQALSEVVEATKPKMTREAYWDRFCSAEPWAPECLIYDI